MNHGQVRGATARGQGHPPNRLMNGGLAWRAEDDQGEGEVCRGLAGLADQQVGRPGGGMGYRPPTGRFQAGWPCRFDGPCFARCKKYVLARDLLPVGWSTLRRFQEVGRNAIQLACWWIPE